MTLEHRNCCHSREMLDPIIKLKQKKRTFNSTWLKTYQGFEGYSEEEAEDHVEQLQKLAEIVSAHVQKSEKWS